MAKAKRKTAAKKSAKTPKLGPQATKLVAALSAADTFKIVLALRRDEYREMVFHLEKSKYTFVGGPYVTTAIQGRSGPAVDEPTLEWPDPTGLYTELAPAVGTFATFARGYALVKIETLAARGQRVMPNKDLRPLIAAAMQELLAPQT